MISDPSIREQGYIYFLTEAPELLELIEQELFSLSEGYSINKIHNLMRATHTIKGGAANVGLEVINKISHSLEDVFQALYNPDVEIDTQLQTLLFQAYECLQLPITAEITGSSINDDEQLQRAALVFAQLQEKLGDAFGAEAHIPTSEELGFDIVLSIFETGVTQRIESIAQLIHNPPGNVEIADFLVSQAGVFIGLAESLNLAGFGEIAKTIIAALDANPTQALKIASLALEDLQQAREAVLAGDRIRGGEPSSSLQKFTLAEVGDDLSEPIVDNPIVPQSINTTSLRSEIEELYKFFTTPSSIQTEPLKPTIAKFYLKVIRYIFGWFNHKLEIPESELILALLLPLQEGEITVKYLESWLSDFIDFVQEKEDSPSISLYRQGVILTIIFAVAKYQYSTQNGDFPILPALKKQISELGKEYKNYPPVTAEEKNWIDSPKLQQLLEIKEISPIVIETGNTVEAIWGEEIPSTSVDEAVKPEDEDYLDSTESLTVIEELIADDSDMLLEVINNSGLTVAQKIEEKPQPQPQLSSKNNRQRSFVRVDVEGLQSLNYLAGELLIYLKRRTLQDEQFHEAIDEFFEQLNRHQATLNKLRDLPLQMQSVARQNRQNLSFDLIFDSLEWDEYTEFNLAIHEALEETLQLQETTESLELLLRQSAQTHEKKQRLALGMIDTLVEARMSPLGNILNRFPQMIQNLGNVYGKRVELKLTGSEVLVDKAIAEKLYDPLLHLVRNAFDHGIEPGEVRLENGKRELGLIEIRAYHQGSQTIIEVRDDGHGLNLDRIRQKGIELGLIPPEDRSRGYSSSTTTSDLLDLLFTPGFSTAGKVSEISGRGMGLDIVRSQLQGLDGSIAVQSLPKVGTTFILKIPFSMTTDKLMLVQAGGVVYALLLEGIEKILLPSTEQIKQFENKKVLHWNTGNDERMISLRQLSDMIYYSGSLVNSAIPHNQPVIDSTPAHINPILLLRRDGEILGLEVDQIIGEQELVIRPLSSAIAPPKYIYGCSSLANGTLILVIDGSVLLSNDMVLPTDSITRKALPILEATAHSTPLLAASSSTDSTKTQLNQSLESTNKTPKVVLVVDDAISLRQTLTLTLQKYGYQVLQAQNGVEALEQLQRYPEILVVISDLEMPRMNGFELLSSIRKNNNLAQKPVVVLTSRSAEKHRQLAHALGATAYMTKPYLEHEFLSTVQDLANGKTEHFTHLLVK
ncbi:MAG: hybrid sensor histidine kinase/response regulator [Cyanomargarita calcarea GSE-NOS-MK-12-04C]|jgi:chemotaxis family two-component system sensor histidine kinase/response regulator PixL|uniref:histidine kinase n=1 Tax=Cyanomargarita calcarea GSE-NOS-MK-12-04C TaxID=2839659 RepID=A0A951QNC4_9CYAN|nr:hybrid sensor histidine kinase/response regulator [Cyanomargarita calcarea GSE-NOS-MK-12-04C]